MSVLREAKVEMLSTSPGVNFNKNTGQKGVFMWLQYL